MFDAAHFDAGHILNPRFSGYCVRRFTDIPPTEVMLVDRRDLPSAGAGETRIGAIAPALACAPFDTTGRRLRLLSVVGRN